MRTVTSFFSWRSGLSLAVSLALGLVASVAQAHPGHGDSGFVQALAHPFEGWDHLLAMLAVGMWSVAALPAGRRLAGPAVFLLMLCVGVLVAWSGISIPGAEVGVALSVVLLGGMLLMGRRLAVVPGLLLVGIAAFAHGTVHGAELGGGNALAVTAGGVVLGSAALQALGLMAGQRLQMLPGWCSQLAAGLVGSAGLVMLATRL